MTHNAGYEDGREQVTRPGRDAGITSITPEEDRIATTSRVMHQDYRGRYETKSRTHVSERCYDEIWIAQT